MKFFLALAITFLQVHGQSYGPSSSRRTSITRVPVFPSSAPMFPSAGPVFQGSVDGGFASYPPAPPAYTDYEYHYGPSYGPPSRYGPPRYEEPREDPLKKIVLLSGMASGKINPLTAVAINQNQGMSAADTALVSSMGNNGLTTAIALTGGFSGGNGQSGLFGGDSHGGSNNNMLQTLVVANALSPEGGGDQTGSTLGAIALTGGFSGGSSSSKNNMLQTLVVASALAPKKEGETSNTNNALTTLATLALLSKNQQQNQNPPRYDSHSRNSFGSSFGSSFGGSFGF
jgi:hypothetical protein